MDINTTYKRGSKKDKFGIEVFKGRIAEALIEQLFISSDYMVIKHGVENSLMVLIDRLKGNESEIARELRKRPDLIVYDKKKKAFYYVEVKFRMSGDFFNLESDYPYPNAYFIVVSPNCIKCMKASELMNGNKITKSCGNLLSECEDFKLKPKLIKDYEELAGLVFERLPSGN